VDRQTDRHMHTQSCRHVNTISSPPLSPPLCSAPTPIYPRLPQPHDGNRNWPKTANVGTSEGHGGQAVRESSPYPAQMRDKPTGRESDHRSRVERSPLQSPVAHSPPRSGRRSAEDKHSWGLGTLLGLGSGKLPLSEAVCDRSLGSRPRLLPLCTQYPLTAGTAALPGHFELFHAQQARPPDTPPFNRRNASFSDISVAIRFRRREPRRGRRKYLRGVFSCRGRQHTRCEWKKGQTT